MVGSTSKLQGAGGVGGEVADTGFTIDFSNTSYTTINAVTGEVSNSGYGMRIKPDGTQFYWNDQDARIHSIPMSTAFDLNTAGTAQQSGVIQLDGSDADDIFGIDFNNTGTKVYISAVRNLNISSYVAKIQEHSLSTAWDITTVNTTATNTFDLAAIEIKYLVSINLVNSGTELRCSGTAHYNGELDNWTGSWSTSNRYAKCYKWDLSTAYDLSTASLDANSRYSAHSFFLASSTELRTFDFASSDSSFGILGNTGRVYNMSFTTEGDLSTGTVDKNAYFNGLPAMYGMRFGNSGSDVYVCAYSAGTINRYSLSTAYDLSTMSSTSTFNPSEMTSVDDVFFKDSTTMFIVSSNTDKIHKYTLSTAWDPTSATESQSLALGTSYPRSVAFKPDGTKMYIADRIADTIDEWDLTTAWDLSTATLNQDIDLTNAATFNVVSSLNLGAMRLNSTGTKMYVDTGGRTGIAVFTLSTAWDVSTATMGATNNEYLCLNIVLGSSDQGTLNIATANNAIGSRSYGGAYYIFNGMTNYQPGSATSASYRNSAPAAPYPHYISYADSGTKLFGIDASPRKIYQQEVDPAYTGTVSGVTQSNQYQFTGGGTNQNQSLKYAPNGTKFWYHDEANDKIFQFSLSTAYDLGTVSINTSTDYLSTSGLNNGQVRGLDFDGTGSTIWIAKTSTAVFYGFDLSTAYDVTTAAATPDYTVDLGSTGSGIYTGQVRSLRFNDSGKKMIISDHYQTVYTFDLSTAYDISTASADTSQNLYSLSNNLSATPYQMVTFNKTGTRMIVKDDTYRTFRFDCSTAFDPTSATYTSTDYPFMYNATNSTYYQGIAYDGSGNNLLFFGRYSTNQGLFQTFNVADEP